MGRSLAWFETETFLYLLARQLYTVLYSHRDSARPSLQECPRSCLTAYEPSVRPNTFLDPGQVPRSTSRASSASLASVTAAGRPAGAAPTTATSKPSSPIVGGPR